MRPLAVFRALAAGCNGPDTTADGVCADADTSPAGTICTIAGRIGFARLVEEGLPATESDLYLPIDTTLGPDGLLYIIDWNNHRIRVRDSDRLMQTLAGSGSLDDGPEARARMADFNHPTGVVFTDHHPGVRYIATRHNRRIERLDMRAGLLTFERGDGDRAYGGDGGPAKDAILDLPSALFFGDGARGPSGLPGRCGRSEVEVVMGFCCLSPQELSDGQAQRVAIARALAADPPLILADEPTGNLDSRSGAEILELFVRLNAEGRTIVLVTHDEHVAGMAGRRVRMEDGRVVSDDGAEVSPHS